MRRLFWVVLAGALCLRVAAGQQLSPADKAVVEAARARYYNLERQGFMSAACQVRFDLSTLPALNLKAGEPDRKVLEQTRFTIHIDSRQPPSMEIVSPNGVNDLGVQGYSATTNLLKSLVTGFFQTWPSKGLNGPVPSFDSQIKSVSSSDRGYSLMLLVPGAPVRLEMDKDYRVTQITSLGGKIDERPGYVPSPGGLVFASNAVIDDSEQGGRVTVQYEIQSGVVDGLQLPKLVHLRVNENIDVKFTLNECSVVKGKVIELRAP